LNQYKKNCTVHVLLCPVFLTPILNLDFREEAHPAEGLAHSFSEETAMEEQPSSSAGALLYFFILTLTPTLTVRQYCCTKCPAIFQTKLALMEHIVAGHEDKTFCELCNGYYANIITHYRSTKHQVNAEKHYSEILATQQIGMLIERSVFI
jgi:hypothetical protein